MDFEQFSDQFFQINQTIQPPVAYAVEYNWYISYQNFLERIFEGSVQGIHELQQISNHNVAQTISCQILFRIFYTLNSESEEAQSATNLLKQLFKLTNCSVTHIDTREQCLDERKQVMKDYVIVSGELWDFLERTFGGGPKLPVFTIPYHQIKLIQNHLKYDFITHMNIETIPNEYALPTKNVRFLVLLQLDTGAGLVKEKFVQFHLLVPLVLRLKQFYDIVVDYVTKYTPHAITPEWESYLEIYLPAERNQSDPWLPITGQQMLYDVKVREDDRIMIVSAGLRSQLNLATRHTDIQEEQKHTDKKTRSTGPSTKESQDFGNSLNISNNSDIQFQSHENEVWPQHQFAKEVEEVTKMIAQSLKEPTALQFLPLEDIKCNIERITNAIELELQPKKK